MSSTHHHPQTKSQQPQPLKLYQQLQLQKNSKYTNNEQGNHQDHKKHVVIIVCGDIGRSPRMQYHASTMIHVLKWKVTLIGYKGEDLIPSLMMKNPNNHTVPSKMYHPLLRVIRFDIPKPFERTLRKCCPPLYLMLRGLLMIYGLFKALWYNLPRYGHRDDDDDDGDSNDGMRNDGPLPIDCILVQNPPSIPLLLVAYLRCRFSGFSELLGGFPFGKNNNKNNHQQQHGRPGLIIDWHNLGYTMFEGNDVLVDTTTTTTTTAIPRMTNVGRIVKEYERQMSKLADGHLYVTHAMERWVNNEFLQLQSSQKQSNNDAYHERGAVLHDRPPSFFQPIENYNNNNSTNSTVKNENKDKTQRQHDILCQLEHVFRKSSILAKQLDGMNHPTVSQIMDRGQEEEEEEETMFDNSRNTLFTTINSSDMKAELKPHRPWLIVSSTSWTPDEDFSILMNALILLDSMFGDEKRNQNMSNHNNNKNNNIRLIVIITGKGPLQSYYQRILESSPFPNQTVQVLTPWLKPIEYPLLISIADIGICLHVSTSGLCLPMKVLDMFGCHIPVLARSYATIREELVYDGKNGRVFENAVDLVDCLVNVLNLKVVVDDDKNNNSDKRNKKNTLSMMRMDIASRMKKGWDENWIEFALPVLLSCCSHNSRSRHSTGKDKFV